MKITIYAGVPYRRMAQRPSMLARALDKIGHRVTYISPDVLEQEQTADGILLKNVVPKSQDVLWVFSGWAATLLGRVKYKHLVLDVLDHETIHGCPPTSTRLVERRADCIFAVSSPLYEHMKSKYDHVFLLYNAVENDWIRPAATDDREPGAIYAGCLPAPWLSIKPLFDLADADVKVALAGGAIGYNYDFDIPKHKNITHNGIIPYEELPVLLSQFRLGLIPFNDSLISRYADPLKFYQYLACGLSVLVTPYIPLPFEHPQIYRAEAHDWANVATLAIKQHDPQLCVQAISGHTWEDRAKTIDDTFAQLGFK